MTPINKGKKLNYIKKQSDYKWYSAQVNKLNPVGIHYYMKRIITFLYIFASLTKSNQEMHIIMTNSF